MHKEPRVFRVRIISEIISSLRDVRLTDVCVTRKPCSLKDVMVFYKGERRGQGGGLTPWSALKGVAEGRLRGKVRAAGQAEDEEDEDAEDKMFADPFGALVKNCSVLHIAGPACIFLKQGFAQTVVCKKKQSVHSVSSHDPGATFSTRVYSSPSTYRAPRSNGQIPRHRTCSERSIIQFHGKLLTGFVPLLSL